MRVWKDSTIGEAVEFTSKPRGLVYSDLVEIPFVPMDLVPVENTYIQNHVLKPGKDIRSGNYFEKGDCLIAKITPCFENGKQGIVRDLPADFGVASTELIPFRGRKGLSNKFFLFYFFLEATTRRQIAQMMEGATGRQRIPISVLKDWPISLPLLPEQKKIAAVLLKIQRGIEIQEKIIQSVRDLKKSTMQHVFTCGLHGEKTKMTEIGEIPESWNASPIGQFSQIIMGHSPKGHNYNKDSNGLPLLNGPAEFTNKYPSPIQWTTSPTRIAKQGDLLFCVRGNTVARMNIADQNYCIGRGLAAIRGLENISTTDYLYFVIQHNAERIYRFATAGGSTFPNFSKGDFDSLSVQKPNINEQKDIAAVLGSINQKMEFHESKKAALQDLFKTTLNKLMTGEIRVNDLDIDVSETE